MAGGADLFEATFRHAGVGMAVVDLAGCVVRSNRALEQMLGYASGELAGVHFADLTHADDRASDVRLYRELLEGSRDSYEFEKRYVTKDGREVWGLLTVWLVRAADGAPVHAVAMVQDITQGKRNLERLKDAEFRYRTLVEQIPGVMYVNRPDLESAPLYISPQAEAAFGYPAERWIEDPDFLDGLLHEDDRARILGSIETCRSTGESFDDTYRILAADGRWVWVHDLMTLVRDRRGEPAFWQGIMIDVTREQEAEASLQRTNARLRELHETRSHLLSRLVTAQEDERRQIAVDIHDGPVQKLTAAVMRLDIARKRHPELGQSGEAERILEILRVALQGLRHMTFRLRPPILETQGLAQAILTFLRGEVGIEDGLAYRVEDALHAQPPEEIRVLLYRLAQEALVNVRKHARAGEVVVAVGHSDGGYLLRVADDGVGFESSRSPTSPAGHLGLTSIRERAELAGGWCRVRSRPGHGTVVQVWVPEPAGSRTGRPRRDAHPMLLS